MTVGYAFARPERVSAAEMAGDADLSIDDTYWGHFYAPTDQSFLNQAKTSLSEVGVRLGIKDVENLIGRKTGGSFLWSYFRDA